MLLLMLLLPNAATGAATWCCYCVLLLDAATHAAPKCFGMQVHKIKNARTKMHNSMRNTNAPADLPTKRPANEEHERQKRSHVWKHPRIESSKACMTDRIG